MTFLFWNENSEELITFQAFINNINPSIRFIIDYSNEILITKERKKLETYTD